MQDYSLANPDTLTKLKGAAEISQKVLKQVKAECKVGVSLLELCQKGDKLLEEETGKVYKGKKIAKGISFGSMKSNLSRHCFPNLYFTKSYRRAFITHLVRAGVPDYLEGRRYA